MTLFLESGALLTSNEDTRKQFWRWLNRNARHIKPRERSKLAGLTIWPDETGRLGAISDLCNPRSRGVGMVLTGFIRRPHQEVRRSNLVSAGGRARTSIRRVPTEREIANWLDTRTARFKMGSTLEGERIDELRRFETDLVILLKVPAIARLLKQSVGTLPALAEDGSVQSRSTLVVQNQRNSQLALPDRYVLRDRERRAALDRLSPALVDPTAAMLHERLFHRRRQLGRSPPAT